MYQFNVGNNTKAKGVNIEIIEADNVNGGNNVNMTVGNKTDIKGATIATGSYGTTTDENGNETTTFNDNGNLTLATNELTYENINDFYKTEQKGFSFSTSVGAGTTDKGSTNLAPQGSTSIGLTSTGQEKEQTTYATIGNGTIVILANVNFTLKCTI